ncbi:MAG: Hsp20/alpha crystallin family protein [Ardenticatenaceae bacterium]|nr:Hsp20/alpha crystallin family protein [Ardenticatenaceae bacterium]
MSITRWEPFRDVLRLRDAIDRLFGETLVRPRGEWFAPFREAPALDIYETNGAIEVAVPLPGVKPEEVSVTVTGNTLTIKGEKHAKEEVKEENYYRREVHYGSFARSLALPATADTEKAEAKFEDGVLTVTFPKVAEAQPKRIEVKK